MRAVPAEADVLVIGAGVSPPRRGYLPGCRLRFDRGGGRQRPDQHHGQHAERLALH